MRLGSIGLMLTAAVTSVLVVIWGAAALVPGVAFGGLATAIQVAAVAAVKPVWHAPFKRFLAAWGVGMAMRMGGVVVFLVAVLFDRALFPPLPTAFAYLGVLLPLLFIETRFLR